MSWIILAVTPQRELPSRNALIEIGISALVPVEFCMRQVAKNKTFKPCALIPGYVFAEARCLDAWADVRRVDGVRLPLRSDGRCAFLTQRQADALELLSKPAAETTKRSSPYRIGDRIRIRRGAMADLYAAVADLTGGSIVADVAMFGGTHRVKVDAQLVEAA